MTSTADKNVQDVAKIDSQISDVPLYEMVEKKGKSDPNYYTVSTTMTNRQSEAAATRNTGSKNNDVMKSKKLMYLVAILVSAVMLVLIFGCFIFLFREVVNLKSEMSSLQQALPSERASVIMGHLQQINENFSSIEDRFEDVVNLHARQLNATAGIEERLEDVVNLQNKKVQQLNISILSGIADTVNLQNNVQQLNTSIFSSIEDTVNLQNNVQQLNTSIDGSIEERLEDLVNQINVRINGTFSTIQVELTDTENFQNSKIQQLNTSLNENTDLLGAVFRGFSSFNPATSCAALHPFSHSGYYWVSSSNVSAVLVYCDMTRSCGGVTGGWRRVAELDMTNSSQQCPSGLTQRTDSNIRTCGINSGPCSSVNFAVQSLEYSKVCGKIRSYQVGSPDAFGFSGRRANPTIEDNYVDGVSLTHGHPRQHIWTFAAGLDEVSTHSNFNCPCTNINTASQATPPPDYVGSDYFCDTGAAGTFYSKPFHDDDPLWDGAGCGPLNTCCTFNNPPWFYKQLPQPTTDDIEMRLCTDQTRGDEDSVVEIVDIYVQ